ncbi:MAG: DUF4340 domain-containing protein, partial [Ghiorsea sp.]
NKWLKADDASVEIQTVAVGQLLRDLQRMKVRRVASHQAEHHARFAVDDGGVQVLLKDSAGKMLLDVMVGKPATDLVTTYVRMTAENTVITVNKTLTWQVKRTPEAWLVTQPEEKPLEHEQ